MRILGRPSGLHPKLRTPNFIHPWRWSSCKFPTRYLDEVFRNRGMSRTGSSIHYLLWDSRPVSNFNGWIALSLAGSCTLASANFRILSWWRVGLSERLAHLDASAFPTLSLPFLATFILTASIVVAISHWVKIMGDIQVLILDGKLQSAEADEFVYHESIVHPALLYHSK